MMSVGTCAMVRGGGTDLETKLMAVWMAELPGCEERVVCAVYAEGERELERRERWVSWCGAEKLAGSAAGSASIGDRASQLASKSGDPVRE